ncbi:MAG: hypothetical protein C0501_13060 [Isosphaera sp.]|nr:hypothetical protein [Isosphaera sp.]
MRARQVLALAALAAAAAPALADPPKPAVVVRTQPPSRLLADAREVVRQAVGPGEGDRVAKQFDESVKDLLGEKGFEGVDLNRPLAAYVVLKEKVEESVLAVVVPVTGEKEFVDFLGRLKLPAEAVKDKPGVYSLGVPGPKGSHLQFAPGGWAYLTLNDGDPTPAKDLVAPGDLLVPGPALVSASLYPDRVPPKLLAFALDELDNGAARLKNFAGGAPGAGKSVAALFEQGPKMIRRYAERARKEAAEIRVSFAFDPATGETATELAVVPRPGTALAKEFAARPAGTNRFAGLVPKDATAGLLYQAPTFAPELRDLSAASYEDSAEELKDAPIPDKLKDVLAEGLKGLARAAKAGEQDAAIALLGPDKNGKFTVVAGLSLDGPAAVEKALRAAAKDPELGKGFEFDAAKVGGVGVHKVPFARLFPDDAREVLAKAFGNDPPGYVAFAKDAAFVGFGPGGLDAVKAALEAKPGPAPVLDVTLNTARLHKLVAAFDEQAAAMVAKFLGTDDKPATPLRITVEGGAELKVKLVVNVRHLPRLFVAAAVGGVEP